jgi:prevent-host-death family protein
MTTTVTATEAARKFSDLLNRVLYRGESFVIVRNGEEVAQLTAVPPRPTLTWAQIFERLAAARTGDPTFAEDIERIRAEQPPLGESPWDS